jgi:hypothetical protein
MAFLAANRSLPYVRETDIALTQEMVGKRIAKKDVGFAGTERN